MDILNQKLYNMNFNILYKYTRIQSLIIELSREKYLPSFNIMFKKDYIKILKTRKLIFYNYEKQQYITFIIKKPNKERFLQELAFFHDTVIYITQVRNGLY